MLIETLCCHVYLSQYKPFLAALSSSANLLLFCTQPLFSTSTYLQTHQSLHLKTQPFPKVLLSLPVTREIWGQLCLLCRTTEILVRLDL